MPRSKKRKKKSPTEQTEQATQKSTVVIHRSTKTTMVSIAVMLAIVGWLIMGTGQEDGTVPVIVPTLTPAAMKGSETFNRACQDCHGDNAGGSPDGPALVNPIYRPGHHADGAFRIAIAQGVRAHHWKFGPMPAQPDVKPEEIRPLITFIREMQRANGVN